MASSSFPHTVKDIVNELPLEDERLSFDDNFFDFEGEEIQGDTTSAQPQPIYSTPLQEQTHPQPIHYTPPQDQAQPQPIYYTLLQEPQPQPMPSPQPLPCLMTPPSPPPRFSRPLSIFPPPLKPSLRRCPPVPLHQLMSGLQAFDVRRARANACLSPQGLIIPSGPLALPPMPMPMAVAVAPSPSWSPRTLRAPSPCTPLHMDMLDLDLEAFTSWSDEEEEEEESVGKGKGKGKRAAPSTTTQEASNKKAKAEKKGGQQASSSGGGKEQSEVRPGRVRSYAYVGMALDKGEAFDWRGAVQATWQEAYPEVDMPEGRLDIDDPQHVEYIIGMLAYLCPKKEVPVGGTFGFAPQHLRKVLTHPEARKLFDGEDFLSLNLTTTTGTYMSVRSGLLALLARALEVDSYKVIVDKENVLKWHSKLTSE